MLGETLGEHPSKFLVRDTSVVIVVQIADNLPRVPLPPEHVHQIRDQQAFPLGPLEMIEGLLDLILPQRRLAIHRRRQKISPIESVLSRQTQVVPEDAQIGRDRRIERRRGGRSRYGHVEFAEGDDAVVVLVEFAKDRPEGPDLRLGEMSGDVSEGGLLEFLHPAVAAEGYRVSALVADRRRSGGVFGCHLHPLVLGRLYFFLLLLCLTRFRLCLRRRLLLFRQSRLLLLLVARRRSDDEGSKLSYPTMPQRHGSAQSHPRILS
mmetsp:Transcript_8690/g.26024  ORF Transcript_8690/g.26024 Transcript_8690/m.26024 type:complete len:264 (-) Transcript_8690:197-988(-)